MRLDFMIMGGKFRRTILVLVLWAGLAARAADPPPSTNATATATTEDKGKPAVIDADKLTFDKASNLAIGEGNVTLKYQEAGLRADRVRYNSVTREVWADGHVRLNRNGQEWTAPALYYNFATRAMKMSEAHGFFPPMVMSAQNIHAADTNCFYIGKMSLTTCDYDNPHYRFEATRAEIYPNDRVVLHNVTLRLGQVPVLWLPVMILPLGSGLDPFSLDIGSSTERGFFVLTKTRFKLNDKLELTALLDERTRHGVGVGAESRYNLNGTETGKGYDFLRGYYAYDRNPYAFYNAGTTNGLPYNRYVATWQHKEFIPGNLDLTVDANKLSDQYVMADFFPREYRHENEPQTVVDLTKRGDQYTLSALVRPQLNRFFAEVERLPEAKWAVNRLRLWQTPIYYEGESSAGFYHNVEGNTGDPIYTGTSARVDSFHQLVSPQMFFGWLSVIPRAGGRYTYYEDAPDWAAESNQVARFVGNLGVDTSFKLSHTWNSIQQDRMRIDGLRHIVEPFANYQYIPEPNVASTNVFQFDTPRSILLSNGTPLLVTRYLPFEFPAYNTIDAIDRESAVRFGVRQRLQTRRDGKPWDLIELTVWDDYRIVQNPGETQFSELFGSARVRPLDWLAFEAFTRYNWYTGQMDELDTAVHVSNADRWSIGLGTRYLRGDSDVISGSIAYKLTRKWTAAAYVRVDVLDGTWEEQAYMLRQEIHDWYIDYGLRWNGQRTGGNDMSVFFAVTLKAFPRARIGME